MKNISRLLLALFCVGVCGSADALSLSPRVRFISAGQPSGASSAVVVDGLALAHTTQVLPVDSKGEIVGKGNIDQQVEKVFNNLALALGDTGKLQNVVKLNIYVAQPELAEKVRSALVKRFSSRKQPATTFVVGDLSHPDVLVAMDAVATTKEKSGSVKRSYQPHLAGETNFAHVAILPPNGSVYVSGQADKGELLEATRKTLEKLDDTLHFLGLKKEDVVQCKSFLQPMAEVAAVKKEFEKFFAGQTVPPLVFVDWTSKDVPIEIELIANGSVSNSPAEQVEYLTPPGMTPSPIYAKVARVNRGKVVYISGLYGNRSIDAGAETLEIFNSLGEILKKAGSDFQHLVKATYYVSNNQTSAKLNEIRPQFYSPNNPPAASKAMVKDVGVAGKGITMDMIAVVPDKSP